MDFGLQLYGECVYGSNLLFYVKKRLCVRGVWYHQLCQRQSQKLQKRLKMMSHQSHHGSAQISYREAWRICRHCMAIKIVPYVTCHSCKDIVYQRKMAIVRSRTESEPNIPWSLEFLLTTSVFSNENLVNLKIKNKKIRAILMHTENIVPRIRENGSQDRVFKIYRFSNPATVIVIYHLRSVLPRHSPAQVLGPIFFLSESP